MFKIVAFLSLCILFSCSFSDKTTVKLLEKSFDKQYDLVIVPGYPFPGKNWHDVIKIRVWWSKYLFDQGIAKNLIYSGSAVYTPYVEAEIMSLYAQVLGIPKENIFTENTAEHSSENIYYCNDIARKMGFTKVALATDPFQAKLLKKFTRRKVNKDIVLIPIVFDTLRALNPPMYEPIIQFEKAYVEDFISIIERETLLQRLRGTKGKAIDKTRYK